MLLILAEANAFNTSGAYHEFPKWGWRRSPPAPFGEGRPEAAPIICSASIKSIGHYLFQKPSELKVALYNYVNLHT